VAVPKVNVKAIREALGLSAAEFAMRYNLNKRTVEGWEQGRRIDEAANNYLHLIACDPQAVAKSFEQAV
jgi:DNA-binding transcriptional regulator YiaG